MIEIQNLFKAAYKAIQHDQNKAKAEKPFDFSKTEAIMRLEKLKKELTILV